MSPIPLVSEDHGMTYLAAFLFYCYVVSYTSSL